MSPQCHQCRVRRDDKSQAKLRDHGRQWKAVPGQESRHVEGATSVWGAHRPSHGKCELDELAVLCEFIDLLEIQLSPEYTDLPSNSYSIGEFVQLHNISQGKIGIVWIRASATLAVC